MKHVRLISVFLTIAIVSPIVAGQTATDSDVADNTSIWIEKDGVVVIEPEQGALPNGWITRPADFNIDPTMSGSLGDGWLEWSGAQYYGNTAKEADANAVITYTFEIETEGDYVFRWRSKQYNRGTFDAGNDTFVRFNSGTTPNGFEDFGNFTKVWVQSKKDWSWNTTFEPAHSKHHGSGNARRHYKTGTHSIQLAARSPGHAIDRIVLHHVDVPFNEGEFNDNGNSAFSSLPSAAENTPATGIYGETDANGDYKKWHRLSIAFEGPETSENATPNPFTQYRLNVTFTHPASGKSYVVPGYYAADGNAGETGASEGNIWRVHFSPDEIGKWNYSASFRGGNNIAIDHDPNAGTATSFDGTTGSFTVATSDKDGIDHRGKGRLQYDGTRYLKFAETGEAFLKVGADAPENFLAYRDFDNTYNHGGKNYIKSWSPHVQDWNSGDPIWKNGKGKGIIGAINYLSVEGQNVFSFLTYNAGGDSKDVWPYVSHDDPLRFDCSKLDQWEIVFTHGDRMGMYLHFKTQETENDDLKGPGGDYALNDGNLGLERKLYYRELISRFGHHLALNWNLGEENTQSAPQAQAMAQYFDALDPYDHNIVLHTYPDQQELRYRALLGNESKLTGASIQKNYARIHSETLKWIEESAAAGKQWVVANDEQGPANFANPPDNDYPGYKGGTTPSQKQMRSYSLWGNFMAGGAGIELYAGYKMPESDLTLQNFRSRDRMWDYNRHTLNFFSSYLPYAEMRNANQLVGNTDNNNSKYCFAKPDEVYAIYLPEGGVTGLDLRGITGDFSVRWYNPRDGGPLQTGSVPSVEGGSIASLGSAPSDPTEDWAILVERSKRDKRIAYIHGDVAADGTIPSGNVKPYHKMLPTDTGKTGLSHFKSLVEADGYTIDQFYDQETTLNTDFLKDYDIVIFGLHQKIWPSADKAALNKWLQTGGGMLIYSDSASGGKHDVVNVQNSVGQSVVNNLIGDYGMEVTVDQANGVKAFRPGPTDIHPILEGRLVIEGEGVSPVAVDPEGSAIVLIPYIDDPDFKVSGNPAIPHQQNLTISDPTFAALALAQVGNGKIMVMFDRQPMWNDGPGSDIEKRDNQEILKRIIQYLGGDRPT